MQVEGKPSFLPGTPSIFPNSQAHPKLYISIILSLRVNVILGVEPEFPMAIGLAMVTGKRSADEAMVLSPVGVKPLKTRTTDERTLPAFLQLVRLATASGMVFLWAPQRVRGVRWCSITTP